ncbi:MAG TPA: hypothetical protein VMK53_09400 [Gemmatimonadales bacterium]|nr:hypothetical protein [Gemmatimonadales bacterium]
MSEWGGTLRLAVVVRLDDGEEVTGELFLQERVPHHSGTETPLDLLERSDRFFPLALPDGTVIFIGKAHVGLLRCDPAPPESELDRLGITRFAELELAMADGLVVRGRAGVTQPPTRLRALDCLNGSGGFLAFWVDEAAYYINRALIRVARPIE